MIDCEGWVMLSQAQVYRTLAWTIVGLIFVAPSNMISLWSPVAGIATCAVGLCIMAGAAIYALRASEKHEP